MFVVCAIMIENGCVFVAQRPPEKKRGGRWEFPGGKVHAGETPETCIERELMEELDLVVRPTARLEPVEHAYPDVSVTLLPLICHIRDGNISLNEHAASRWAKFEELATLDLCEADRLLLPQIAGLTGGKN